MNNPWDLPEGQTHYDPDAEADARKAPLVLHADTLDATAAAHLLLERWPGAILRTKPPVVATMVGHHGPFWLLGWDTPPHTYNDNVTIVDPTPDASIAMQVWRLLNTCEPCAGLGKLGEETCAWCHGARYRDDPPTWLRYLDDAVCGRFEVKP